MSVPILVLLIVLGSVVGLFLLYVLYIFIVSRTVDTKREYDKNSKYFRHLLYSGTGGCFWFGRIKIHVSGREKIPDGRFLMVSNHRSNFDPMITWQSFKDKDLAFISKKENFSVPIYGRLIRKCCFMAIDRVDPRNAIKTINKASELIKKDEVSIVIYPEGTRSKKSVLLPFHDGVFKIAQKAKVPVVVIVVRGTEQVHKRFFFRKSDVYIDVLDTFPTEYVTSHSSHEISAKARNLMIEALPEEQARLKAEAESNADNSGNADNADNSGNADEK